MDSDGYRWFVEMDGSLTLFRHEEMPCYSHLPRNIVEREYGSLHPTKPIF